MAHHDAAPKSDVQKPDTPEKRHETLAFVFLSVVLFPALSIILVGGFGFILWMKHLLVGLPGGP